MRLSALQSYGAILRRIAECEQFALAFGGSEGLIQQAGNPILPGYTIPKLLWLKNNEPENFSKTKVVLLPHDYINFRLTGVKRMEYGDASGTGFLNVRTREWANDIIDFVDPSVEGMLPPLGSSNDACGTLLPELAERWGVSADVLISAGGGDQYDGSHRDGQHCVRDRDGELGTSGTLYGCSNSPLIDPSGEVAAFCDSTDRWLPLVCTMNVTVVTEMIRGWFGWDHDEMERQILSVEGETPAFLPYLNGERTPNLPNSSGVLHGLRGNSSPAQVARAAMEGATIGLGYGLKRFQELGLEAREIRLTGGGSKSGVWRQIAADVFGTPVVGLATSEGAGLGGAIQAAHVDGQGTYDELCDRLVLLDETTRCIPDPERVAVYQQKAEQHQSVTSTLSSAGLL